jgi:hypothetical protein
MVKAFYRECRRRSAPVTRGVRADATLKKVWCCRDRSGAAYGGTQLLMEVVPLEFERELELEHEDRG